MLFVSLSMYVDLISCRYPNIVIHGVINRNTPGLTLTLSTIERYIWYKLFCILMKTLFITYNFYNNPKLSTRRLSLYSFTNPVPSKIIHRSLLHSLKRICIIYWVPNRNITGLTLALYWSFLYFNDHNEDLCKIS